MSNATMMNTTDQCNLYRALAAVPPAACLVRLSLDSIARAVPEEYYRQMFRIHETGDWWSSPGVMLRGLIAQCHVLMLRLSLCIHSKARIARHLEALRLYLAIPEHHV